MDAGNEKGRRRQFSREYKLEAVRMVTTGGRAAAVVAEELGVHRNQLRAWQRQLGPAGRAKAATLGVGAMSSQDEEVRRLRREVARLTQERDFLKSATVFFAKESR